jgi:DNA-binding response OmpR family regulator
MHVLVVEDEELIRTLVCSMLEEAAFDCRAAADAEQAFIALDPRDGWRPDVLVTDYNLGPGPNGAAVAAEAMRRLPDLHVIYMTGNPECLTVLGRRERLIAKPFKAADLIAVLDAFGAQAGLPRPAAAAAIRPPDRSPEARI